MFIINNFAIIQLFKSKINTTDFLNLHFGDHVACDVTTGVVAACSPRGTCKPGLEFNRSNQ